MSDHDELIARLERRRIIELPDGDGDGLGSCGVEKPDPDCAASAAILRDLRSRLAAEIANKKQFERDWLEACDRLAAADEQFRKRGDELVAYHTRLAAAEKQLALEQGWNRQGKERLAAAEAALTNLREILEHRDDEQHLLMIIDSAAGAGGET